MACQRPSPIVMFERDVPTATFLVTADGEPYRFVNQEPQLYIVDPEGAIVTYFNLNITAQGVLTLDASRDSLAEAYEEIFKLVPDISYSAQIFMQSIEPPSREIGLLDIVDPYWMDYVPPPGHVPGYWAGEVRSDQTVPTEFPWTVFEAYKLRGTSNG